MNGDSEDGVGPARVCWGKLNALNFTTYSYIKPDMDNISEQRLSGLKW